MTAAHLVLALACGLAAPGKAQEPRPEPRALDGAICGDPAILGAEMPPIAGEGGCGMARPVRVSSVSGVALSPQPTITCGTARALRTWVDAAAKPELARDGGRLTGLDIAADYVCRNVNRAEEGDLSEHARGRAIDISAFRLADGRVVTVLEDWGSRPWGRALRQIRADACGTFRTTLGPGSDAYHEDHLHLDVAQGRRRPYCR